MSDSDRLAFVGGERRGVDDPRYLRIRAGFGDDDTAVGMTNQHDRTLRPSDREFVSPPHRQPEMLSGFEQR